MKESTIKKWTGKYVSIYGYDRPPYFFTARWGHLSVLYTKGVFEKVANLIKFPMWIKLYEEGDEKKSLLGNTGILVDIPEKK